jgi:succinate-acetate transporter protein
MEAAKAGSREADIAPAPQAAPAAGWTPANPSVLGAAAFALTTFVLSMFNAGLVGNPLQQGAVLGLMLFYGGIVQLLAGMWEFRTGNTFGALLFSSFGGFWLALWYLLRATPALTLTPSGISLFVYAWAIFSTLMFIASLRTTGAVAVTLLLLTITLFILGIGFANLAGTHNLTNGTIKLGGWFGLLTAVSAWYVAFAGVMASTFGRDVLPVYPLNR